MFKLIVVCAFFAAAAAEPGALLYQAPITQYSTLVQPATTTIVKQGSSFIHGAPIAYQSASYAYPHFIKKRSPQWAPAVIPIANTYNNAWFSPAVAAPLTPALPVVSPISPAIHLIKKRSAPLLPTTYFAPGTYSAAAAPILSTAYTASAPLIASPHLIPSTPLISQPIYSQFIKK